MPAGLLAKYFRKLPGGDHEVVPDLRNAIDFRQINLLEAWPQLPRFDVVFCRNVLIYFDAPTKTRVLGRIRSVLRPDGYLFLGAAETVMKVDDAFENGPMDRSGCFRLPDRRRGRAPSRALVKPALVKPALSSRPSPNRRLPSRPCRRRSSRRRRSRPRPSRWPSGAHGRGPADAAAPMKITPRPPAKAA